MQMRSEGIDLPTNWSLDIEYTVKLKNRRQFLRQCAIDEFKQKEEYWVYRKRGVTHDGTIIIDHTHKVAYKCKSKSGERMFDAFYRVYLIGGHICSPGELTSHICTNITHIGLI